MGATEQQLTLDQQNAQDREQRFVDAAFDLRGVPSRPNYAAGVLLDTRDFEDEQDYHRGRLGRALAALVGFGTLAGLRATCVVQDNPGLEVQVAPGLALDRIGRLVEVRRTQCLAVADWLAARAGRSASAVETAERNEVIQAVDPNGGNALLRLDVWLRFLPAASGRKPAFAAGPFDATDYAVPSRMADGFEITFDVAADPLGTTRLPANRLPALDDEITALQATAADDRPAARLAWMLENVLSGWPQAPADLPGQLAPLAEHRLASQWNGVLLARVTLPVAATSASDAFPRIDGTRLADPTADLADNRLRPFVFLPTAWRGQTA